MGVDSGLFNAPPCDVAGPPPFEVFSLKQCHTLLLGVGNTVAELRPEGFICQYGGGVLFVGSVDKRVCDIYGNVADWRRPRVLVVDNQHLRGMGQTAIFTMLIIDNDDINSK